MRARRGLVAMAAGLGILGLGSGVAPAGAAGLRAPDGLTPIVAQLKALQRHEPAGPASMIAGYLAEIAGSGSLDTQSLDAELNGISQGLQQIELENQGNPHNGLVSTIVNELNDYVSAHGGTPGPTPGGGDGGGTPA
jgi:hypothetical protein